MLYKFIRFFAIVLNIDLDQKNRDCNLSIELELENRIVISSNGLVSRE